MASFTLSSVADAFPVGTSVGAYLAKYRRDGSSPMGSATDTATVASSGALTFDELAHDTAYVAYASVNGAHRYRNFSTDRPTTTHVEVVGTPTQGDTLTWDGTAGAWVAAPLAEEVANLLDYMDGAVPDGTTTNSAAIADAVTAALADGYATIRIPSVAEQWCVDEPLPMSVNWRGDGRDTNGTRIKALASFEGEGIFDLSSTSNVLRTVENMKIDCGHVPGVQAFAGGDAIGAGTGLARNIHIQNCAPGPCTRLTAGVTLGGTQTLSVESTAGFKKGSILPAGSATQPVVTSVDSSTQLTVSGGSGTLASGLAIEQPTYAIGTRPLDSVSTGAMVGWLLDGVQLNNCAHWVRLPTPAGDDINTRSLRASAHTLATATTTLAANFVAGTDTTVSLTSATAMRTSGRVVIDGQDVWYSGKSGNTLTGVYTAHVGTINSGTAVYQYNRPIIWPIDVSSVNMRFTSSYFGLGKTDMVANGGVKSAFRLGGNEIKFDGTFVESVEEVGWTHLFHTTDPSAEFTVDGLTLNVTSVTSFTALVRAALSAMSANQRKRITVRNIDSLSNDVLDGYPIVDVFVDTDAESDPNGLDFHVEGVNDMSKLGRFGASSTVSAGGAGVVRVTGMWKGARLDDNLACLAANADWPDIISHYVRSYGTPESVITARPGSTCHIRRAGTGVASFYPAFFVKVSGSGNTGWVGDFCGSGAPDFDATTGSQYRDTSTGITWEKVRSGTSGWVAASEGGRSESPNYYGAVGNGSTDDTTAVQAAATAAIANDRDLILNPATSYKITDTIDLVPASGASFRGKVIGVGETPITWAGGNGTDGTRKYAFLVQGMKRSRIEHVNIQLPASATYVHGWELDDTTGTYTSLSQLTFANCNVFGSTGNTGCGGWRIGHIDDTGNGDFSIVNFENCGTAFGEVNTGQFHIVNEGANSLGYLIDGGHAYYCKVAISNLSTTGAGSSQGGGSFTINGFTTSHCDTDFQFLTVGNYVINGGRFEVGKRFLDVANGGGSNAGVSITASGFLLASYVPSDNILFYLGSAANLVLVNPVIKADGGSDYTSAMITASSDTTGRGSIQILGGSIQAADLPVTISAGAWIINTLGVSQRTNAGLNTTHWKNRLSNTGGTSTPLELNPGAASGDIGYLTMNARYRQGYDGTVAAEGASASGALVLGDTLTTANRKVILARLNGTSYAEVDPNTKDLRLPVVGTGLQIKQGSGGLAGNATLVGGTVAVTCAAVDTNSIILLTRKTAGGTTGELTYTITDATSFTINSASGTDTSTVSYLVIQPAP